MTRDDIIRMAIKCELVTTSNRDGIYMDALARFAALVAAAEREACATICDVEADEFGGMSDGFYAAKNSAEAIRARGDT